MTHLTTPLIQSLLGILKIAKSNHLSYLLTIFILGSFSCTSQNTEFYNEQAVALNNRAYTLLVTNPDSALLLLHQATTIDPDYYLAHNNKVNLFILKGEIDRAIKSAEKGVEAKPDVAEAVTMLGMLYDYAEQPGKAKKHYTKALELYNRRLKNSAGDKFSNRLNRAQTLLLLGKREQGQKELQKLLQEQPKDARIRALLDFDKQDYLNDLFGKE